MVIARKVLIPTLALFGVLLLGLALFFVTSAFNTVQTEEERYLLNLSNIFEQDLRGKTEVALALAKQVAGNPEVVQAAAQEDRTRLIVLTYNAFKAIQPLFNVTQEQFITPQEQVLLRVHEIDRFGDNLSPSRAALVQAAMQGNDISGLELADDGLALRGVASLSPGRNQGVIDIGIAIDQETLQDLKSQYGSEWQISLTRRAAEAVNYTGASSLVATSSPDLALLVSTRPTPLFAPANVYLQVLNGQAVITRITEGAQSYSIISSPLRDYSNQVVGVVDIIQDRTPFITSLRTRIITALGLGVVGLLLIGVLVNLILGRILGPIGQLTSISQALAEGDLSRSMPPSLVERMQRPQKDELDLLAASYDSMANQLRRLVGNLEERVTERTADLEQRTRQLRAVAEITREVTTTTDVQTLLEQAVQLVRQRFDFYHAGVFLIDEKQQWAVLQAATGEAGRRMLEAGHRLQVGQEGIVGRATGSGQTHVTQDITRDASYYPNPHLPDTRSEMALPLRLGNRVVGALDVQSVQPNAFDEGDIAVLQILADQLAIAFNNARLIQDLNRSIKDMENAYSSLTKQTWDRFARQDLPTPGYRYRTAQAERQPDSLAGGGLEPLDAHGLDDAAQRAIETNQTIMQPAAGNSTGATAAAPIRLRGQAIGVINLRFDTAQVPQEMVGLLEEVGSRLGLVLESARLLHEAQRLAAREQQINVIATEMRSSVDLDAILQNTVRQLGKALGARRTYIRLGQIEESNGAPTPEGVIIDTEQPHNGSNGHNADQPSEATYE